MAKEKKQTKEMTGKQLAWEWIKDIIIAVIIAIIIIQFIRPTIVKESSMEPNFYENDYLFIYKKAYSSQLPKKGDVIVFRSQLTDEKGDKKLLIKRVIGLPGDTISVKDGEVYINGKVDDQSYTADQYTSGDIVEQKIPEGEIFCMGDNREVSIDSRDPSVGNVKLSTVEGKVVFRVYRFSEFGRIANPYDNK